MACDLTTGAAPLPGGIILRTATWTVEHCIGPLGVGTLVVKPIRHVLRVADLTAAESAELGPLRGVSQALTSLLNPVQVYVCPGRTLAGFRATFPRCATSHSYIHVRGRYVT